MTTILDRRSAFSAPPATLHDLAQMLGLDPDESTPLEWSAINANSTWQPLARGQMHEVMTLIGDRAWAVAVRHQGDDAGQLPSIQAVGNASRDEVLLELVPAAGGACLRLGRNGNGGSIVVVRDRTGYGHRAYEEQLLTPAEAAGLAVQLLDDGSWPPEYVAEKAIDFEFEKRSGLRGGS